MELGIIGVRKEDYRASGGVNALWKLYEICKARGVDVAMLDGNALEWPLDPEAVYVGCIRRSGPLSPAFTVPLPANEYKSVQWLLSPTPSWQYGQVWERAGERAYYPDFAWDRLWYPGLLELYVPIMDWENFYPGEGKRHGAVSWCCESPETNEITHLWPRSHAELGDVLRHAECLLSGRDDTLLNAEARICGCPVVTTLPRAVYRDPMQDGIAFGIKELEHARETVGDYTEKYQAYEARADSLVDRFISIALDKWTNRVV